MWTTMGEKKKQKGVKKIAIVWSPSLGSTRSGRQELNGFSDSVLAFGR